MQNSSPRDQSMDIWKGLLVFAMLWAHIIQILGYPETSTAQFEVSRFVFLSAFPSFFFVFGYVTQLSYFSGKINYARVALSTLKIILVYYILAIAYERFFDESALSGKLLLDIFTFFKIPGFTEYLPPFALVLWLGVFLRHPFEWITSNIKWMLGSSALLLATTFIPYNLVTLPQLSLLVGAPVSVAFSFPVLQYLLFFLWGMYCARRKIEFSWRWFALTLTGMAAFYFYKAFWKVPLRFPPSFGWILASVPFTFFGYFLVRKVKFPGLISSWLQTIGANTLFYLLLGNVIIFSTGDLFQRFEFFSTLAFLLVIMAIITLVAKIFRPIQ